MVKPKKKYITSIDREKIDLKKKRIMLGTLLIILFFGSIMSVIIK